MMLVSMLELLFNYIRSILELIFNYVGVMFLSLLELKPPYSPPFCLYLSP